MFGAAMPPNGKRLWARAKLLVKGHCVTDASPVRSGEPEVSDAERPGPGAVLHSQGAHFPPDSAVARRSTAVLPVPMPVDDLPPTPPPPLPPSWQTEPDIALQEPIPLPPCSVLGPDLRPPVDPLARASLEALAEDKLTDVGFPVAGGVQDTVIIFDWDDTLLCSSSLGSAKPAQLSELTLLVDEVLKAAMCLGLTLIVTNAHLSWVKDSASRFMSALLPTLERLPIVSARERHEHRHPGDCFAWKREAFREVLHERVHDSLNLLVLGDSLAEIHAAEHVAAGPGASPIVKTVKFKESPSPGDLIGQLRALVPELARLVDGGRSLSKTLVRRMLPYQAPPDTLAWTLSDVRTPLALDSAGQVFTSVWEAWRPSIRQQDRVCPEAPKHRDSCPSPGCALRCESLPPQTHGSCRRARITSL